MGPRPMLGLSRRTYPAKCSRCPHAARPTLPAALEGTMLHRCHCARTGHSREAQPSTRQGLHTCLINRYSLGDQTTTTGISASAYAPRYWGRPKAGGNAPRKGSLVRSIETGTGRVLPTTCGQNSQRPGVRTEQPETRRADRIVSGPACGQNSQRHDVRTQQSAARRADRTFMQKGRRWARKRSAGTPATFLHIVRTKQSETRRADTTVSGPACGQNSQRHDVRTEQSAARRADKTARDTTCGQNSQRTRHGLFLAQP